MNPPKFKISSFFISFFILFIFCNNTFAQGDGPRSNLLAPIELIGISTKYMHLNQNLTPTQNLLVKDVDFTIDIFPTTIFTTFGIGNRFAQVFLNITPGAAKVKLTDTAPGIPGNLSNKGLSDGVIGFKLGLIGAPALTLAQLKKHKPTFSMFSNLKIWYSGSYRSESVVNLGSNRWTIDYGLPMAFPLGNNPAKRTWLEIMPRVQFFTKNTAPSKLANGKELKQKPLFRLEAHLSHNFTKKFWASINFGYKLGGQTSLDGKENDNKLNLFGGVVGIGYQVLPFLGASADYGRRLAGENNATSKMIRLGLVFTYINLD